MTDRMAEWRALVDYARKTGTPLAPSYLADACDEIERLRIARLVAAVYAVRPGECPMPFALHRAVDETGVSGTGNVAYGAQFHDGRCVLRWATDTASTAVYDSIEDVEKIHGHNGATKVVWLAEHFENIAQNEEAVARVRALSDQWARAASETDDDQVRQWTEDFNGQLAEALDGELGNG